jgi:2-polyprenyl-6-hydroxyphenyl methylase/3-demethylubiquinone-9 3-methyltransferase
MFKIRELEGALLLKKTAKISGKMNSRSTIDAAEVQQFNALASQWWDESGPLKPLHQLNPARMGYIKTQICNHFGRDAEKFTSLAGLCIADVGCGGGLVTEPLCRLGADVTGVDAGEENIKIARQHAAQQGLDIDYKATTVEKLAAQAGGKFDVVTALEIIEHVADPELFLSSCCKLLKKNGLLILSTLNRTPKSFMLGIVAAEYVLRWLPAGTHDWKKFMKPSEIARPLKQQGLEVTDISGLVYNPLKRQFSISKTDIAVNYFLTASRSR